MARGTWESRHREGKGAKRDRRRDQPMRDCSLLEQRGRHRVHGEGHDKEADTAIGEHRTGQHHRYDCALLSEPVGYAASD